MRTPGFLLLLAASSCTPAMGVRNRDTQTLHNADATHVWLFQQDGSGNDFVLYCDSTWPSANRALCARYPNLSPVVAPPPPEVAAPSPSSGALIH